MSDEQAAKNRAKTTYNDASDHFDDAPLEFWARYGRRTVNRLTLAPGASVLDVGCGTGASALPAAEKVGAGGHVIGVDLAEKLLALARAKAEQQGLSNIEFRTADMDNLDFPDNHFDAIISVFSIFFVPDMERVIGNLWRLVKPGGQLAITTWGTDLWEPMYGRWREALQRIRPDLYTPVSPWDRITTVEALRRVLQNSGVTGAEIVAEDGTQAFKTPEDWWTVALGSGLRGTIEQMTPDEAARVREDNLTWAAENHVQHMRTNVIYAVATKR